MKYQKVAECPQELVDLLALINLLPRDLENLENQVAELNHLWKVNAVDTGAMDFLLSQIRGAEEAGTNVELTAPPWVFTRLTNQLESAQTIQYERLLKSLPVGLAECLRVDDDRFKFTAALRQLESWINEKRVLRALLDGFQRWVAGGKNKPETREAFRFPSELVFSFNDDYTIRFPGARALTLINTNKKLIERIRICPICDRFYWAKRVGGSRNESQTCQKKCSDNFHQRNRRIREYEVRLEREMKAVERLSNSLAPGNSLITERRAAAHTLEEKIEKERKKNGYL